jgi:protein SCO1/2
MMELLEEEYRDKVQVIMISVDPERDTPQVVDKYAKYFNPTFIGLTGSEEDIKKVAKEYKAFYKKVEGQSASGYLVDHTAYIYLIDREGNLKLIYSSSKQKPELMAQDVRKLLED